MTARFHGRTPDSTAVVAAPRAAIVRTGWSETARRCGLDRTSLHRAFRANPSTRSPNLGTVAAVALALGLELTIRERPRP